MLLVLAQAELGTLQTLVKEGGPFAMAFALLIVGGLILWKYALNPAFQSLAQMHKTTAECASAHAEASRNNLAAAQQNAASAQANQASATITSKMTDKLLEKIA